MKKYQFEVCANSVESCLAAQAGGADRVELCAGIPEGGTTPSYGEISTARDMLTTTRLHVIIRPRGGDFLYSPIEVRTMLKDIEMARQLGADGVVFFDVCRDPEKALEQIIELGCNRILTSGQQATAELGIPLLKTLQTQASGRIILLAGCGVNEKNIVRIASETGIQEFHFSARESIKSDMKYKNESVSMGGTVHIDEYERNVTTAQRVINTIQAIKS